MNASIIDDKSINRGFYFISFGAFFIMLSLSTHLPAYPHMLQEFNLTPGYAVWMQLGLAVGLTGFQPLLGWIGDSYGLKLVLIIGGIFMVIGSLLVALSFSFWVLVLGLFFKGVSGAAIAPSGIAYAGKFMEGERRGKAIGTFMAFVTIGALFGPVISGSIVDGISWQGSFVFTAILGAIAIAIFNFVPRAKVDKRKKLDILGLVFVIVLLLGLLTVPTFINSFGFSSGKWIPSLVVFLVALVLLIVVEKKQKEPLLDIEYVANRSFWVPTSLVVFIFLGYSGVMYLLTFFVQNVQGKPATTVGLLQMAIFLGTSIAAFISGRILKYFSARVIIGTAILLFSTGIIMLSFVNLNTPFSYLFVAMSFIGLGGGFKTPAIKGIIVSKAATDRMNVVTFTNTVIENIAQRLGASFALVAFGIFSANGNNVQAMANTSWIIMGFIAISLLFLPLIPRSIHGIHESDELPDTTIEPTLLKQKEVGKMIE
ncbi:MFS transporter [Sporosarcina ureilytica]|uniref:MFS transporter n=1 Tax=Sporosarcina ureilytica TaxID=298596 RepID=A0A1D8JFH9_9BACL|nr:MFS transporter [Sporosarcina ureilytica]AOV07438.1 MFS transporter [Sporosarcina ureilytica]